jgi:molybdopterin synthase catalytic subunit
VSSLVPPTAGDDWVGLTDEPLPVAACYHWASLPSCGAVVLFSGTARDHAPGRPGVHRLEYEAYEEQVEPRLAEIVDRLRAQWPGVARAVIVHRIGEVPIGEASVLVVASSPHRDDAFAAARFGIDTVKETVPIWKRESWEGGESWGLDANAVRPVGVEKEPPTKLSTVDEALTTFGEPGVVA